MNILVTGGAGYIGSHTCKYIAQRGHRVVTYDNLETGHREMVRFGSFEYGDIRDYARLRQVIATHKPDAVIHFASRISVGESVTDPGLYYDTNVAGSLTIMRVLRDEGVRPLVVSGSAAVYGASTEGVTSEEAPLAPINPYGRTKLILEWMLADFAKAYGLPWMALRYFNAAGADSEGEIGEWHEPETHLIPNILRALFTKKPFFLFGTDYPTPDGTCIRDYIHVQDLAAAHVLAVQHLLHGAANQSINLGTGQGTSIREIVTAVQAVTGKQVPYEVKARREGDPARLVAYAARAKECLGWEPKASSISNIIETAWLWEQKRLRRDACSLPLS
ncbi:MAG: UDP-glucose 4-epimerase GalE [Desulfovibrio sp.]|nr:UDP-glucose 4-epimerase GalE [Desulfovibrio sp.]